MTRTPCGRSQPLRQRNNSSHHRRGKFLRRELSHLQENLAILKQSKNHAGWPLRVEELPMPAPVYFNGQRLPASYANFYVANKLVLVPVFNDPNDRIALNIIAKYFFDREVIGVYCRDLVLGLGTIHCMTQQIPAAG